MQRENKKINIMIEQISNTLGFDKNLKLKRLIYSIFLTETNGDVVDYKEVKKEVNKIIGLTSTEYALTKTPYLELKKLNTQSARATFAKGKIIQKTAIKTSFEKKGYTRMLKDVDKQKRLAYSSVINSKISITDNYMKQASRIIIQNNLNDINPMRLKDLTSKEHKDLFKEAQIKTMIRANDNMKIKQQNGAEWNVDTWYNRELRVMTKELAKENNDAILEAYDYDLVFVDYVPTCSPMCIDHQNRIYSKNGNTPGYDILADHEWDGGKDGLFHPNCYHSENVYIKDVSDKLMVSKKDAETKTQISDNYKQEQVKRNNERQIRKYRDKIANMEEVGKLTGVDIKQDSTYIRAKDKLSEYNKKPHNPNRLINYQEKIDNVL